MRSKYAIIPLSFLVLAPLLRAMFPYLPLARLGEMGWRLYFFLCCVALPILVLSLVGGGLRQAIDDIGLSRNPVRACLFGLAVTAPAFLGFFLTARSIPLSQQKNSSSAGCSTR